MTKFEKIAIPALCVGIAFLFLFSTLGVVNSKYEPELERLDSLNKCLNYKLDSLEQSVNQKLINHKDTILIHVVPQQVKIYNQ